MQQMQSQDQSKDKSLVIFVIAGPGAGKGTVCQSLVQKYGFIHLSTGDLLREEQKTQSKDSELIQEYIKQGLIVPGEITVRLAKNAVQKRTPGKFLLDGFPRSMENLLEWNKQLSDIAETQFMLVMECSEDTSIKRIQNRANESSVERIDDNIESIRKRFVVYKDTTKEVIQYFKNLNKLELISCEGQKEEVFKLVEEIIIKYNLDKSFNNNKQQETKL